MMWFIKVHATDPYSEEDDAYNAIYVRPGNIAHIESYSGPISLQGIGPDGRSCPNGKSRMIVGAGLIMLGVGGTRIVRETPDEIIALIQETEKTFE